MFISFFLTMILSAAHAAPLQQEHSPRNAALLNMAGDSSQICVILAGAMLACVLATIVQRCTTHFYVHQGERGYILNLHACTLYELSVHHGRNICLSDIPAFPASA